MQRVAIAQGQMDGDEFVAGKQRARLTVHAAGVETEKVVHQLSGPREGKYIESAGSSILLTLPGK